MPREAPAPHRIFLLSPAHCGGKRAGLLFNDAARFDLARRIREPRGVPLGEVFSFVSGLYFRGKIAYAGAFGRAPAGVSPSLVITSPSLVITTNRGLVPAQTSVTLADLRDMGCVDIASNEARYRHPLARDAGALAQLPGAAEFVLLGSVATGKYVDVLREALGERLLFPAEFVGRGDMSRGGVDAALRRGAERVDLCAGAGDSPARCAAPEAGAAQVDVTGCAAALPYAAA